jgi:hypothetical protein
LAAQACLAVWARFSTGTVLGMVLIQMIQAGIVSQLVMYISPW